MSEDRNTVDNIIKMATQNSSDNDPNYDEIMKNFKLSCPVKKINLSLETPGAVCGMWLLTSKDGLKQLKDTVKDDMDDVTNDTFLFFTNQHIVEMCNILHGMLEITKSMKYTLEESIQTALRSFIQKLSTPDTYNCYKNNINEIVQNAMYVALFKDTNPNPAEVMYKLITEIMYYIPFVSYNNLDDLAQKGIDEFNQNQPKESKDGKSDIKTAGSNASN